MTRYSSKALLFVFVALVTSPAVWADPDHSIDVSVDDKGHVKYDKAKGNNKDGFIHIDGDQEVLWTCKGNCKSMTINIGHSGLGCYNSQDSSTYPPGPLATSYVTCDVNSASINNKCQKSASGPSCSAYTTTVYYDNGKMTTDDPEFIVDDSFFNLKTILKFKTVSFGILGLLVGVGVGFLVSKSRGRSPALTGKT